MPIDDYMGGSLPHWQSAPLRRTEKYGLRNVLVDFPRLDGVKRDPFAFEVPQKTRGGILLLVS